MVHKNGVDSRTDRLSVVLNRLQHLFNDSCVLSVGSSTSIKLNLKSSDSCRRAIFLIISIVIALLPC